ncbi:MerR family transcriptional regulator [Streptomyces sp. CG1]|uniref:MerR family transcriptional regulator n=1 Tax=Streptomyces sp. CG1 TaxID=1287523 RepID=UPI0034E2B42E
MDEGETYLTIGEVSERLEISAPTLRYWEERGLLRPATRQSGRRLYGATELRRIALIRIWQESGMLSLDEIATVLTGRAETGHWRDTVHGRLAAIDEQTDRLARAGNGPGHRRARLSAQRPCRDLGRPGPHRLRQRARPE